MSIASRGQSSAMQRDPQLDADHAARAAQSRADTVKLIYGACPRRAQASAGSKPTLRA